MKKVYNFVQKVDFISDFRIVANLIWAFVGFLFLTPITINNFIQHRLILGVSNLALIAILELNAWSIIRGRFRPLFTFMGLAPVLILGLTLVIHQLGIIGVLWCFPAILGFYFVFTERQAWLSNITLLIIVLPLGWVVLENPLAVRVSMTLIGVSLCSALFIRVISYQQHRLLESKERAEAANRAKSEFLANMSHELRTPLNAILGFSQLMIREPGISSEQLNNLETIGRSGEHLLSLINNVLEFSKIEADRIVINQENFDLHRLLLGIEEMFRLRTQKQGLSLVFKRGDDVPQYIRTDQNKLRQILINLLGNAVKFTEKGGITLRITNKEPGRQTQTGGCLLYFEVVDSGVGILPEEQSKIFDAFFQTDDHRSSQQGTGLGLSISRKFVKLMGGVLEVNSEVGKGTSFTFDIPVELTESADVRSSQLTRRVIGLEAGQPVYRLLVAEDNENNRNLLVRLLRTVGFEVQEVVNGQDAVEIWKQWQPHLIWMDMRMPVMDGYGATAIIKSEMQQSKSGIDTKIIAITASAFKEDRFKVIEHGCDDFVRKPFREFEIFEMIKKHLGVLYVYGEGDECLKSAVPSEKMSDESLSTSIHDLPEKVIVRLKEATELSDAAMIDQVIEEIRTENAQLAEALSELVENFAYDKILALVQKAVEKIADEQG